MPRNRIAALMNSAVTSVGLVAVLAVAAVALGQPLGAGDRPGPPPEAVTACQGKYEGDAVQLQTRDGRTLDATCRRMRGDQWAAMPDRGPQAGWPSLSPEAAHACEGKHAGDTVSIQTPRGDTVPATCRLLAVPQK